MRRVFVAIVLIGLWVCGASTLRAPVGDIADAATPSPPCGTPVWTASPGVALQAATLNSEISHLETCAASAAYTQQIFPVINYGANCNGAGDDSAAIQAAINAAESAGGGIVALPIGTCQIRSGLTINQSNVLVQGQGLMAHHSPQQFAGSLIRVAFAGTGLTIAPPLSPTGFYLYGGGVQNVGFDSDFGTGNTGLWVQSDRYARFDNIWLDARFKTYGSYWGAVSSLGDNADTFGVILANIDCATPGSFVDTGTACFYFDGDVPSNTDFSTNIGMDLQCSTKVMDCVDFNNADANLFLNIFCFQPASATSTCINFINANARNNLIIGVSGTITGTGIHAQNGSFNNQVVMIDPGNAFPTPTTDAGGNLVFNFLNSQDVYGTCSSVATTGTTCTFPNGFAFQTNTENCTGAPQATSSPVAVAFASPTTTSIKAYSEVGTITTLGYHCRLGN